MSARLRIPQLPAGVVVLACHVLVAGRTLLYVRAYVHMTFCIEPPTVIDARHS